MGAPDATLRGARSAPLPRSPERFTDAREHNLKLTLHVPRLHAKDTHPIPAEVLIPQAVTHLAADMGGSVDLDGEPWLRGKEVDDGGAKDDLAPKLDAQPTCPEGLPEDALRRRGVPPRVLRTRGEEGAIVTK